MSFSYDLCGFKLVSAVELPELPSRNDEAAADIEFRMARVPLQLEGADRREALFQTRGAKLYLLSLPGTGRFLVRDGETIDIEPEPGTDAADVRAVLMGPVLAVLWHQRELLPLQANIVVIDGRTVAIAGSSGAGKSTLAAALARCGHRAVADNMAVVDVRKDGACVLRPGTSRLRLWQDVLDHFGIPAADLLPASSHSKKFLLDEQPATAPETLSAICLISSNPNGRLAIRRLRGRDTGAALHRIVHTRRAAMALGREADLFTSVGAIVASGTAVWRCECPRDLSRLNDVVDVILGAL